MNNAVRSLTVAKERMLAKVAQTITEAQSAHNRQNYSSENYLRGQAAGHLDAAEEIDKLIVMERSK